MNFGLEIALPIGGLVIVAIAMPFLWALVLPEGIPGLIANFVLSALVIVVVVSAYFVLWHAGRNGIVLTAIQEQPGAFWLFFVSWSVKTSLFWAPVLVLSVAAQPRRWKDVVW